MSRFISWRGIRITLASLIYGFILFVMVVCALSPGEPGPLDLYCGYFLIGFPITTPIDVAFFLLVVGGFFLISGLPNFWNTVFVLCGLISLIGLVTFLVSFAKDSETLYMCGIAKMVVGFLIAIGSFVYVSILDHIGWV